MTDTPATLLRPDLPRATIGVLFIVALIASTVWILRLAFGLIGIFVGPVVLAVSYTLLVAWIGDRPDAIPKDEVQ